MHFCKRQPLFFAVVLAVALSPASVGAQSTGTSGSISGTIVDPSNAVVPHATVELRNPVSGFYRSTVTDSFGKFSIPNVPFNPYHLTVTVTGFAPYVQDIDVRSVVPVNLSISLAVKGASTEVTVEAAGEDETIRAADFAPWRRAVVRGSGRAGQDRTASSR